LLGYDYFSAMSGLILHSRDQLENIINRKSITYREADMLYTGFDTLNVGFNTYYVNYTWVYGNEQFKEIYNQPDFYWSNFAQMMTPIVNFFGELKATAEGKEELALGSEEIEKLKIVLQTADKLIEVFNKYYVDLEEPLEVVIDSHYLQLKELVEYFGRRDNNLYKLEK